MSEEAKRYIKKYFRLNFLESYDSLNKEELDKIITGISNLLVGKYKTKDVVAGKGDHIIYKTIDETLKNKFPGKYAGNINLKRYMKNYISNNFFVNYNDKTLDYIVGRISLKVGPVVSYQSLMNGNENIDKQISIQYEIILRDTVNKIYKYAKDYVMRNVYPMLDIDEVEVSNDLVVKIMNDNKYNVVDLFTRKYDKMIEQMAYENRKKNEQNKPNAYRYIKLFIIGLDDYLEFDELNNLAFAIEETLRDDRYNTKDIVEHKCDREIESMYNRYMMKKNSVYEEEKPKKIKRNPKNKKIQKGIATLLVLATLTGVTGGVLHVAGKNLYRGIKDTKADMTYNHISTVMSNNRYEYLFTKYNDGFEINMDYAVEDYNNYSKFGEVYGYLGIYEMYKHVRTDSLAIMDSFMNDLWHKIYDKEYVTDMKISSTTFIEFAYDRLLEMGCEEVKKDKYVDAVNEYEHYRCFNNDSSKTTMDCILENDKKTAKTIYELMDLYHQYSAKYYKDLSEIYAPNSAKGRS